MLCVAENDEAVGRLKQSGIEGYWLPWGDTLHEGPVPSGLPAGDLREVRARFIEKQGWGRYEDVLAAFRKRDEELARFRSHDEVVLWFGGNLPGQLQLVQVLDLFAARPLGTVRLSEAGDGAPVSGLSHQAIRTLYEQRREVPEGARDLGRKAWEAFRSPDPSGLNAFIHAPAGPLPDLPAALRRHGEEFPSLRNGLSRTDRQLLEEVSSGRNVLRDACTASHHAREERAFLSERDLATRIERLAGGDAPLLVPADGGGAPRAPRQRHLGLR